MTLTRTVTLRFAESPAAMSGPVTALLGGALVGLGITLLVMAWRGVLVSAVDSGWRLRLLTWREKRVAPRVAISGAAAVLVGSFTGWPAAAVLAGLAVWTLPNIAGPDRQQDHALAVVDAERQVLEQQV